MATTSVVAVCVGCSVSVDKQQRVQVFPKSKLRIEGGERERDNHKSSSNNLILKTAWYASELLGIGASLLRSPIKDQGDHTSKSIDLLELGHEDGHRSLIVQAIKRDFQTSYFVTGCLTLDAYEDDCEFADPAGSFRGVARFKRNCTNFGSLIHKSSMKLMKWEDFQDKGIAHWRFSCVMVLPWKPILSATGYTEYYFSKDSGKVCRHVEHWNVPKMALFKQLLRPSSGARSKQTNVI